jgi:phosphohistidine phosphatase
VTETERRLLLLRHAKSSWADPHLDDHDRPLNPRGRRAAEALRVHFAEEGLAPDLVLCSTAQRAAATWAAIAPACSRGTIVDHDGDLYGAGAGDLLGRLRTLPDVIGSVLVVGHNPGLEDLAVALSGSSEAGLYERLVTKFPTAALASLAVPVPWSALSGGGAHLSGLWIPER